MPINISFEPSAAAIGSAAFVGGQGEYQRWLKQQELQLYGTQLNAALQQQQMAASRMNAMQQLAQQQQQMAMQAAQHRNDQFFQMQMMPQKAAIESQQQAFQYGLQGQNQQNLANMQAEFHSKQSTQDFGEQQQLQERQNEQQMRLAEAQKSMQADNQQQLFQMRAQEAQTQQDQKLLQNPLDQFQKNMKQNQTTGYTFSQDQNTKIDDLKNDISAMHDTIGTSNTAATVMPQLRQKISQLNRISGQPEQPPPQTTPEAISEGITFGWIDPQTKQVKPGTEDIPFTIDPKTGKKMVPSGWPANAKDQAFDQGLKIEQTTSKIFADEYKRQANSMTNPDLADDPNWQATTRDAIRKRLEALQKKNQGGKNGYTINPNQYAPGATDVPQANGQAPPQAAPQQQNGQAVDPQAAHDHLVQQLPPPLAKQRDDLLKSGNAQAAQAIPFMFGIVQQYGPDPKKWPPDVIQQAKTLWTLVPRLAI